MHDAGERKGPTHEVCSTLIMVELEFIAFVNIMEGILSRMARLFELLLRHTCFRRASGETLHPQWL
jgi:hypothetical protein